MNPANFGPIDDDAPVFGACRPGHLRAGLEEWTRIVSEAGVSEVVCLLSENEAGRWGLPGALEPTFETHHVPIRDRHLPDEERLARAVDILEDATTGDGRVAIHCNAGLGRTGVVGSAWLVRARGYTPREAVATIESVPVRRSPREAVRDDNATAAELYDLLEGI